jgi:hypothetical protein
MKKLLVILLSGFIGLNSCKQNKSLATGETKVEKQENKTPVNPVSEKVDVVTENTEKAKSNEEGIKGLVVSFYSIGGGIDLDAARKFDAWIAAYKTPSGQPVVYEKIGWGREGEIDYCIQLDSMNQQEAEEFVGMAKGEVGTCKLMLFTVNGTCKKRRN